MRTTALYRREAEAGYIVGSSDRSSSELARRARLAELAELSKLSPELSLELGD